MEKAIFFETQNISKEEYQEFQKFAEKIREQKNLLSKIITDNTVVSFQFTKQSAVTTIGLLDMLFYYRYSANSFVQATRQFNSLKVDSTSYQQLCRQLQTTYQQRFANIKYKKNKKDSDTVNEVKKFLYEHPRKTIQEYNDLLTYIINNYQNDKEGNKAYDKKFFCTCLEILPSVFTKIHTLHEKYLTNLKPCEFKSLTFSTINVLTQPSKQIIPISSLTAIDKYTVNMRISLPNINKYNLTLKYNEEYHGDLQLFKHTPRYRKINGIKSTIPQQVTINYKIKFLDNKLRIILTKQFPNNVIPKHNLKVHAEGVDVNTKHNYMQVSDGYAITYEEKLIRQEKHLRYYLRKRDFNIKNNNNHVQKHGKKTKRKEEKQARRREQHLNRKINELVKHCKDNGIKRIVMEDLELHVRTPKFMRGKDFLQNHKQTALLLNDVKNVAKRLLNKADIEVDFVNARYTSTTCPVCGHIDKNNRKQQETFLCTNCGYEANADLNASKNILERITDDFLREELEYYDVKNKMYKGKHFNQISKYQSVYNKKHINSSILRFLEILSSRVCRLNPTARSS